jgi:hypothetical protein
MDYSASDPQPTPAEGSPPPATSAERQGVGQAPPDTSGGDCAAAPDVQQGGDADYVRPSLIYSTLTSGQSWTRAPGSTRSETQSKALYITASQSLAHQYEGNAMHQGNVDEARKDSDQSPMSLLMALTGAPRCPESARISSICVICVPLTSARRQCKSGEFRDLLLDRQLRRQALH